MATIENWLELLKLRNDALDGINYNSQQEKYVLILASRITELCLDAVILLSKSRVSSVPIVLRTALESYADLCGCVKDSSYPEKMTKSMFWQLHELCKGIDAEKADYYKSIGKYHPVNKRFSQAGLSSIFNGYYKALSFHSHGNLSALMDMHSEEHAAVLGTTSNDDMITEYFNHAVNLFALVLKDTFNHFDLEPVGVEKVQSILNEINGQLE
ncbi:TPA: DUF5677 domain-containing protein [Vibrio vulnificus]